MIHTAVRGGLSPCIRDSHISARPFFDGGLGMANRNAGVTMTHQVRRAGSLPGDRHGHCVQRSAPDGQHLGVALARPVAAMTRGRACAIRLTALAVVLAHRPAPEVADPRQLRIRAVPLGLQLRKRRLGHGYSLWLLTWQPDSHHNQARCGTPTYVSRTGARQFCRG